MQGFLNKKYPFNDDLKYNSKLILFISLGVLGFILVFQPIEREMFTNMELFYLAIGLAISTFFVLSFNLIVIPSFIPKLFDNEKWNIKREIIWNLWTLISISACYYLFYTKLYGIISISLFDLWKVAVIGSIPIAVLIVINHNRLLRYNLKSSKQLNSYLLERNTLKEKLIHFDSDYKKDDFIVKAEAIVVIRAADNYIEIFYKAENEIKKQMIRNTMRNVENIIKEFNFIIKCHRSFIVNTNHIKEVLGNSQGYRLFFEGLDFQALVSQSFVSDFKKHFNI
ncbi:MAG: LytTR family transcriptional regulator DNA-binding domain-containing protein [Bacteroidales bacterium]|nr:LytTR family transcriptional regulator DNA-binding domain-containing protein [Bacteroidales bacterium]